MQCWLGWAAEGRCTSPPVRPANPATHLPQVYSPPFSDNKLAGIVWSNKVGSCAIWFAAGAESARHVLGRWA
jgi:hypothetical protein